MKITTREIRYSVSISNNYYLRVRNYLISVVKMKKYLRVHSHLRFIGRELLREGFCQCDCEKWIHNPLLNLSVQENVDQRVASVDVPNLLLCIILQIVHVIIHT